MIDTFNILLGMHIITYIKITNKTNVFVPHIPNTSNDVKRNLTYMPRSY